MFLKEAMEITGHKSGLGKPSKMPGFSTAISASDCKVGSKLREVKGSVCEKCYAMRGNYTFPGTKQAHKNRLAALSHPQWVQAMTLLIGHYTDESDPYFRIHDSGDFQSVEHVRLWVQVAANLPHIMFWAPTREAGFVKLAMKQVSNWPTNLVIRLSATMIGEAPPTSFVGFLTSTVSADMGYKCPASKQDNSCGDCRACWNPEVQNVDYKKH
jgi:hypothetical protein